MGDRTNYLTSFRTDTPAYKHEGSNSMRNFIANVSEKSRYSNKIHKKYTSIKNTFANLRGPFELSVRDCAETARND